MYERLKIKKFYVEFKNKGVSNIVRINLKRVHIIYSLIILYMCVKLLPERLYQLKIKREKIMSLIISENKIRSTILLYKHYLFFFIIN